MGVDLFQEPHLGLEGGRAERIVVAVQADIGARRRLGIRAGIAALDRAHRLGGARDRGLGEVGGVGIANRLILDRAQAKTLRGVVGRLLQPAVVEQQHLGLAVFEEKLAIVGAFEPAGEMPAGIVPVETGAVEQRQGG